MDPKKVIENKEVLMRAVRNVHWKIQRAVRCVDERFRGIDRPYDKRDIGAVSALIFDVDGKPESEKEGYYVKEVEEFINACERQGDVKKYIKRMYDSIATDANVDWSDQAQVEKLLTNILASQALAIIFKKFKEDTFEIYDTHEKIMQVDALIGKAYMIYFEACEAIKNAGFGPTVNEYLPMGLKRDDGVITSYTVVKRDACTSVFEATLDGKTEVVADPSTSENMTNFFLGNEFSYEEEPGDMFTHEKYGKNYICALATSGGSTSIEQMMMTNIVNKDPEFEFEYGDMLFINGKSFKELSSELAVKNGYKANQRFAGDTFAGLALRDALTDGKSVVTLLRMSYTPSGKAYFYQQEIKLDLDKLNELDRQRTHYNWFRRFLHDRGIWKIQRFPSNAKRDARLNKIKNSPKYQDPIRKTEDRMLEIYKSIKPDAKDEINLVNIIPTLTREEIKPEMSIAAPVTQNVSERERFSANAAAETDVNTVTEPPKQETVKTKEIEHQK